MFHLSCFSVAAAAAVTNRYFNEYDCCHCLFLADVVASYFFILFLVVDHFILTHINFRIFVAVAVNFPSSHVVPNNLINCRHLIMYIVDIVVARFAVVTFCLCAAFILVLLFIHISHLVLSTLNIFTHLSLYINMMIIHVCLSSF